ncbi:sensor histidine kinase [Aquimarina pacifica]|uniref:sensor histidine kinase n=1 Tax=Aquimarina pacifica TaxID=1296415 RepID=UPI0004727FF2|nr:histidine kinase [Aquimarina pacifica]
MLKSGRLYIYGIFVLLIVVFNFIYELEHNSLQEALQESIIIFPLTFLFIWIIYITRGFLMNNKLIINNKKIDPSNKIAGAIIILIKTIVMSVLFRAVIKFFFDDGEDDSTFSEGVLFLVISLSVLLITLFVYFFENYLSIIENRHKMEIQLSKHKSEKIISQYLSLKKQLNPHFLFNSFNSLSALIHIDTHKADAFLQELSNVYRYNLDYSEELVVPVKKEVNFIKSYMALQRIRFRESITINYQIDAPKMKYLIPPMTLELLVENAIKHNIVEKSNPLVINVTTEEDSIIVENNFQPRKSPVDKNSSLGIGLKNLKNQYELIHTKSPTFNIENEKYIARIPLITPDI